jgi:hypothetical protein
MAIITAAEAARGARSAHFDDDGGGVTPWP